MSKVVICLTLLGILSAPPNATSQTRTFITGFELGSLSEGFGALNTGSVQSAIIRSGSYAYRANPVYSNQRIVFASRAAGGGARTIFASSRFYLYVGQLPLNGSVSIVKIGGAATRNPEVDLNPDGSLTLADSWYPAIVTSQNRLSPDGQWHRVEFDVGAGLRVYVDGVLWAAAGGTNYPAGTAISFGAGESPTFINSTCDLYFDDILVDGGSFSIAGLPGEGRAVLLRPEGDPLNLNSWTGGAGALWGLWMPVRNVPASGLPAAGATNMSQIKNGSRRSDLDYKPTVQTYASAGVAAGSQINAVMALVNDGQETSKGGARSGGVWIAQNPAQASGGYSFDYGDAARAIGLFPTGWSTHAGPVFSNPTVNVSTAPVVAVRKASGADVAVDFLGVYVDYR